MRKVKKGNRVGGYTADSGVVGSEPVTDLGNKVGGYMKDPGVVSSEPVFDLGIRPGVNKN
ncbi:hypothetical protein M3699_23020 [Peribacillus simplex]|uniref:hypothetical protein n=1 Tax=Peribacillus simplex TaxID=1478 RepID=UPI002041CF85|nr:hypothetical protein [Peribacillus simplex]MCM3676638.1 hypothetical protein [Peribacillus simplex]